MPMTSSGTAKVTLPTDEQILITREFDAPKELVYRAFTAPDLVKRWWHANRGKVTVAEIDLRVGGKWRYVSITDDGMEVGFHGEYLEIMPGERIVSTEIYEGLPEGVSEDGSSDGEHRDLRRGGRANGAHDPRAGHEQGIPRRDHRVWDGGRPAGRAGPPGAGRGLAPLNARLNRGGGTGSHPSRSPLQGRAGLVPSGACVVRLSTLFRAGARRLGVPNDRIPGAREVAVPSELLEAQLDPPGQERRTAAQRDRGYLDDHLV